MITTSVQSCNIVADLLVAHGVKTVVASPGSRNAPLITAISRRFSHENSDKYHFHVVVDERQAAFNALGMAVESGEAVALVCTSGSAVLNYAPAVAEAFYRATPLIAISADRPGEWIDQDDSQTIHQEHVLDAFVKRSWSLEAHASDWEVNRCVNDALLMAVSDRPGPVHVNLRIDTPMGRMANYVPGSARVIKESRGVSQLPPRDFDDLAGSLERASVMMVAGFMPPDKRLGASLEALARKGNFVVLAEKGSNLSSPYINNCIDATLNSGVMLPRPDIVISIGGALVSRHIKQYLRQLPECVRHISVGQSHTTIDCFQHLSLKLEIPAGNLLEKLATAMPLNPRPTEFKAKWGQARLEGADYTGRYASKAPWSDFKAMWRLMGDLPREWNIHLSNGTVVRYAQLFDVAPFRRTECNRGVSGIDGCTSTAIGASAAFEGVTCLITGDMSCQYDVGALGSKLISPRFKMIVLCNGGGGIFRFVESTRSLPEIETVFGSGPMNLPLRELAGAYGLAYYEASTLEGLDRELPLFIEESGRAAILAIHTPAQASAETLAGYWQ